MMRMSRNQIRDLCGLYCVAEVANYEKAHFFMYLIGSGVTRSRYELTAHDRKTGELLFGMQVDASAKGLEARAHKANTSTDAQAVSVAVGYARQIVDTKAYGHGNRFLLEVEAGTSSLHSK
jgi:hypothetical protein